MSRVTVWWLPSELTAPTAGGSGRDASALLAECTVVVIDQLRATSTMTQALAAGAACVRPCVSVDEARALAAERRAAGASVLTGGERHGVRIEGFDLDNTPASYTRERVEGREIVFTTTNGTAALAAAASAGATKVLLGCLASLSTLVERLLRESGEIHLICAGTGGQMTRDDCLVAGAIARGLLDGGVPIPSNDKTTGRCMSVWNQAQAEPGGVLRALRDSEGGRNLIEIGLGADVEWCAQLDRCRGVIGVYDCATRLVQPEEQTR